MQRTKGNKENVPNKNPTKKATKPTKTFPFEITPNMVEFLKEISALMPDKAQVRKNQTRNRSNLLAAAAKKDDVNKVKEIYAANIHLTEDNTDDEVDRRKIDYDATDDEDYDEEDMRALELKEKKEEKRRAYCDDIMDAIHVALKHKSWNSFKFLLTQASDCNRLSEALFDMIRGCIDDDNDEALRVFGQNGLNLVQRKNVYMERVKASTLEQLLGDVATCKNPLDETETTLTYLCKFDKPKLKILKVFVEQGVDLHEYDEDYLTPFDHLIACWGEDKETLKFLIESNEYKKTDSKNKLLRLLCTSCDNSTFEYLMAFSNFTEEEKIEAYELYGADRALKADYKTAKRCFKTALDERKRLNLPKQIIPQMDVFDFNKEFETFDELNGKLKSGNKNLIKTHSMLINERLLGPGSEAAIQYLTMRGCEFAKLYRYDQMYKYWLYALELQMKTRPVLCASIVEVFYNIINSIYGYQSKPYFYGDETEHKTRIPEYVASIKNAIIKVSEYLFEQFKMWKEFSKETGKELTKKQAYTLVYYFLTASEVWRMQNKNDKYIKWSSEELSQLRDYMTQIVELDVQIRDRSLLHLLLDDKVYEEMEKFGDFAYNTYVIKDDQLIFNLLKLVLECGADPNHTDAKHCTPLHYAGLFLFRICNKNHDHMGGYYDSDEDQPDDDILEKNHHDVIDLLIKHGAHVDIKNKYGCTTYDSLKNMGYDFPALNPKNHLNLKCLSANAIQEHRVEYDSKLPKKLSKFVKKHEAFGDSDDE